MFQTYEPARGGERAGSASTRLRSGWRAGLDALFVPRADEHMGEYVPPSAERLNG